MIEVDTTETDTAVLNVCIFLPYLKPGTDITHSKTWPPCYITQGNLSDYMQLPRERF